MALFQKTKDSPDAPLPLPRPRLRLSVPGEAAAECMRVGQLLVDGEQLVADNLATALSGANGDLLQFADIVLGRFGVGSRRTDQGDRRGHRGRCTRLEDDRAARQRQGLPRREDRPRSLRDRHRRGGRRDRRHRRRPEPGAPSCRRGRRGTSCAVDRCRSGDDPHVHRPHLPRQRRDRTAGQGLRGRRRPEQGGCRRRRGQPRRSGPDHPVGQPHRQPGDARPNLRHPRRAARRASCASGSASTVTSSRRSACRSACTRR